MEKMIHDHTVTEFKLVVRHQRNISADTVKDLIQSRFEVVKCEQVSRQPYGFTLSPGQ